MAGIRSIARPLLASAFILDGIDAVRHADEHAERVQSFEKPLARIHSVVPWVPADLSVLTRLAGVTTVGAATLLALGKAPRSSAAVLAAISIPVTIARHPLWAVPKDERSAHLSGLVRDAALIGGVLIATEDRVGKPSLKWRYNNWQSHRDDLAKERGKRKARSEPLIDLGD